MGAARADGITIKYETFGLSGDPAMLLVSGEHPAPVRSLVAADTLITPSGGERTAGLVPHANLLMLGDMGDDLPEALWPALVPAMLVPAVLGHTKFAEGRLAATR